MPYTHIYPPGESSLFVESNEDPDDNLLIGDIYSEDIELRKKALQKIKELIKTKQYKPKLSEEREDDVNTMAVNIKPTKGN